MAPRALGRRRLLKAAAGTAGLMALSACDNLTRSDWFRNLLGHTEALTERVQRALTPKNALAQEYAEREISAVFPANGSSDPGTDEYAQMVQQQFANWNLAIEGLVAAPSRFSLASIREMPSRTQITRHDCVEGWSAIGKWTGVPLGDLMHRVQPSPAAKYAVFYCADVDDQGM